MGGAFELHHGRDVLHEIITFAKDSVKSINLHALSPADFENIMREGNVLLDLDYFFLNKWYTTLTIIFFSTKLATQLLLDYNKTHRPLCVTIIFSTDALS